jgi:hypothetical protein
MSGRLWPVIEIVGSLQPGAERTAPAVTVARRTASSNAWWRTVTGSAHAPGERAKKLPAPTKLNRLGSLYREGGVAGVAKGLSASRSLIQRSIDSSLNRQSEPTLNAGIERFFRRR